MSARYIVQPCTDTSHAMNDVIDTLSTNGYGEPWRECNDIPLDHAEHIAAYLNATWEARMPPCSCPLGMPLCPQCHEEAVLADDINDIQYITDGEAGWYDAQEGTYACIPCHCRFDV